MAKFKIIANYGLESEMGLEEFAHESDAIRWAKGYCEDGADMGGWENISVGYHAEDGEWIVSYEIRSEDYYFDD